MRLKILDVYGKTLLRKKNAKRRGRMKPSWIQKKLNGSKNGNFSGQSRFLFVWGRPGSGKGTQWVYINENATHINENAS